MKPEAILAESFRLIEAEVGEHGHGPDEWPVVRRMVHASGDLDIVGAVVFRHDAVRAGVQALRDGVPIVTDVRMVAAGINRQAVRGDVCCFIDDADVARLAQEKGTTRSRQAMLKAIAEVGDAVYVVGNAPTALQALNEAVKTRGFRPRLVLALPVGFVSVAESKEEALTLPVPVISLCGRKGGSAMAAAAVNALLELAAAGAVP